MASSKNFLILLPHIWLTYSSFNLAFLGLTLAFKTLGVAYILLSPELGAQVSFLSHRSRFITGHHLRFSFSGFLGAWYTAAAKAILKDESEVLQCRK